MDLNRWEKLMLEDGVYGKFADSAFDGVYNGMVVLSQAGSQVSSLFPTLLPTRDINELPFTKNIFTRILNHARFRQNV